jgi:cytosine/adenosine deaminase-related metal-dependent hydrolase
MLVINNGTVVTMDDARSVYFGGHVVIDGDRITAVGPGSWIAPDASASAEVIDASGMIVMPGLAMATRNGATALGHQTEQLTTGRKADVILVDTRNVMFTPLAEGNVHQIYSHLVFAANGSAVDTTIVDGQILMRSRTVLTMDESLVLREANRALTRVTDAIGWGR